MTNRRLLAAFALCTIPLVLSGCLDDKALDIVITSETWADFSQNEVTAQWTEIAVIDMAQEMRDVLEENGTMRTSGRREGLVQLRRDPVQPGPRLDHLRHHHRDLQRKHADAGRLRVAVGAGRARKKISALLVAAGVT
jgi:hypothetical protein